MKRKALGRGLDRLIPEGDGVPGKNVRLIPCDAILPNPYQPRMTMDPEEIKGLAGSLEEKGMIQPVIVTRENKGFILIAGERRFVAAKQLGWKTVPALIQEVSTPSELLELALIENIQRADLDPIDEANAYKLLKEKFNLSQEAIARKVSKQRATVANTLRLLQLPEEIQVWLREGKLTPGHARTILREKSNAARMVLAKRIMREAWSVRQAEKHTKAKRSRKPKPIDPNILYAQEQLIDQFQTRVEIRASGRGGSVRFFYHSEEELMRLYDQLTGGKNGKTGRT